MWVFQTKSSAYKNYNLKKTAGTLWPKKNSHISKETRIYLLFIYIFS